MLLLLLFALLLHCYSAGILCITQTAGILCITQTAHFLWRDAWCVMRCWVFICCICPCHTCVNVGPVCLLLLLCYGQCGTGTGIIQCAGYYNCRYNATYITSTSNISGVHSSSTPQSDTRMKPLPLTNGHSRYTAVTPERTLVSIGEWPLHIAVINL